MNAGKVLKYILKLAFSGILALIILSVFCLFYFNPPMPIPQTQEFSNTKYIENRPWVSFREGFGFGKTNELGYNDAPISNASAPRIAFIGSSHTVALQIRQEDNFVMSTERLLLGDSNPGNDFECMNLGSAGQFFEASVSNLEYLAKSFDNLEFVVLEAPSLSYSESQFERMLRGEYHVEPNSKSLIYTVSQRIPFIRLMANQYNETANGTDGDLPTVSEAPPPDAELYASYERGFRAVSEMLASVADEYGFKLILLHHSAPLMNDDFSMSSGHDTAYLEIVERCCEDSGIYLVDMCSHFAEHYNESLRSAYGFANTRPGTGHLNKEGHRLVADALYETINKLTEGE